MPHTPEFSVVEEIEEKIVKETGYNRGYTANSLPDVQPSRHATVTDRSFATAGPSIWNSLPDDVTFATSLSALHQKL